MRFPSTQAFLSALLVGCAASSGPSALAPRPQAEPAPNREDADPLPLAEWDDLEPIRFGDPRETYTAEFFPGTDYDPEVTTPDELLGQRVGSRPAHPDEIVAVFRRWAEESPRVSLAAYARSFEGRPLVRAVITSPANHERLDEILANLARLADPRGLSEAEERDLVRTTPASAWMGYSIHGDEISGADASMAVGYHLVAGRSPEVTELLDDLVVVIDPCMNPDGRERFVSQLEQTRGYVPNMDYASMQRGRWPEGRGNHYLFDMNRDWIAGVAPETRGRWRAIREINPQLFVDAHEMWALDTFLFYPQSPAHNPHLPATLQKWHGVFSSDQGAAFDEEGWGFYTREWADAWAPFYSDAWGSLSGAIGILYEMASTDGQPVQRESGEVVSYREGVHRQAKSSLANLTTLRANREDVLADFVAGKRANLEGDERWFAVRTGRNRDREDRFLEIALGQGFEVFRVTDDGLEGRAAVDALGNRTDTAALPAGTLLVPARQPLGPLVESFLGFDPRMSSEDLRAEREELERKNQSKIYDLTAWDLGRALDLDAVWCDLDEPEAERVTEVAQRTGAIVADPTADGRPTAWAVDGRDDAAVVFAAQAMELGLRVHLADEPFTTAGRRFGRGSLLVRRHENDEERLEQRLEEAARRARVAVQATAHGRSPDDGPDLGGGHFTLLARPRIAVLANSPVRRDTFGHLWFLLDHELRVPYSLLDATSFGAYDLRRYNVLVLPPAGGSLRAILADHADALRTWVRGGGTLVACGNAAAMLTDADLDLSAVRARRDVLEELLDYRVAWERERAAREVTLDENAVWNGAAPATEDEEDEPLEVTADEDAWARRFAPVGAFLRAEVDDHSWLTAGIETAEMPLFAAGSTVLMARAPVASPLRFGPAETLRVAGLLWPEARERIAGSSAVTVEGRGHGQVILFAATPGFRGYFKGSARLFANAVVYGPGAGARAPIGW